MEREPHLLPWLRTSCPQPAKMIIIITKFKWTTVQSLNILGLQWGCYAFWVTKMRYNKKHLLESTLTWSFTVGLFDVVPLFIQCVYLCCNAVTRTSRNCTISPGQHRPTLWANVATHQRKRIVRKLQTVKRARYMFLNFYYSSIKTQCSPYGSGNHSFPGGNPCI